MIDMTNNLILAVSLVFFIIGFKGNRKITILDFFYSVYVILIYEILFIVIKNNVVISIIFMILSLTLIALKNRINKLNYKIIKIWNSKGDNGLRLRCIFVITLNISIYLIFKIHNLNF